MAKRGRPKKNDVNPGLIIESPSIKIISFFEEKLNSIREKLDIIESKIDLYITIKDEEEKQIGPKRIVVTSLEEDRLLVESPMPMEYREIVDTVLNKKFGASIEYSKDSTDFFFTVIVPKEYENSPAQSSERSKMILNAMGAMGVREWVELIAKNLGQDICSRIAQDRELLI